MTAADRTTVRAAANAAARRNVGFWRYDEPRCAGCQVELIDPFTERPRYLAGCRTCTDRRNKRDAREREVQARQLALEGMTP